MAQNWISLDLDGRTYLDEGSGLLTDYLWRSGGLDLDALRVPCTNELIDGMLKGRFVAQRAAPLLRLPPELLHEILRLLNPTDANIPVVFLFALTCKLALAVARPHIVRMQRKLFGALAGHRLICIGDAACALADYPDGLLTDKEVCQLFSAERERALGPDEHSATDASLFRLAKESWRRYARDTRSLFSFQDLIWRRSAVSRMSISDFHVFRELCTPHYPQDVPWVLCSLSKREYVRADAVPPVWDSNLALDEEDPLGLQRRWWNLARALLACICWSPNERIGITMRGKGKRSGVSATLARGRWAGDRIEMMTMEYMQAQVRDGEKPWADVTEEVLRLVRELWDRMSSDVRRDLTLCTKSWKDGRHGAGR